MKGRVLVAGDGPDRERLFRFVLARAGFDVTVVDNGRAAIDAVTAGGTNGSQFGVILLDIEMPVIDGYGAARSLRRLGYAGAIIALATDPAPDEAERAASAGCDAMLVKPVARGLLIETVTEFSSCYVTANPVRT